MAPRKAISNEALNHYFHSLEKVLPQNKTEEEIPS